MGKVEEKNKEIKRREKIGKIEKAILGSVGAIGMLAVALVAPNIFQIFPQIKNTILLT